MDRHTRRMMASGNTRRERTDSMFILEEPYARAERVTVGRSTGSRAEEKGVETMGENDVGDEDLRVRMVGGENADQSKSIPSPTSATVPSSVHRGVG